MKPVMKVTVKPVGSLFEGVVQFPNFAQTKLRKEDGSTRYTTVSNLRQAARAAATKYNSVLLFQEPRVAAKRTTR